MGERNNKGDGKLFLKGIGELPGVLKTMGFDKLRPGQAEVVSSVLRGVDTICILPTGTGKTACFTVPTLCNNWKTLVFSPLVALMRDQVQSMWDKEITAGQLSGLQTDSENKSILRAWASGDLSLLYVAPERLRNKAFIAAIEQVRPDMVVLDEAHTLSQWSDNFRPDYCKVGEFIAKYDPRVVSCFTATCPVSVESDIRRVLGIPHAELEIYYPRRKNLKLFSKKYVGAHGIAAEIQEVNGAAIVYCSSIKRVEELASDLSYMLPDLYITFFHGQLPAAQKRTNQDDFMSGRADVVVATNAFGMGIDKADIRTVIHRDLPGSIEALAQEVGRAGRDGKESRCVSFFDEKSLRTQQFFVETGNPSKNMIIRMFDLLKTTADANAEVRLTQRDLAKKSGIRADYIPAIMAVLTGNGVVESVRNESTLVTMRITPIGKQNIEAGDAPKLAAFAEYLDEGGVVVLNNYIEIDLEWLAEKCRVVPQTLRKWLRDWDASGVLDYVPPYRGSITKIVGNASSVDYERLRLKAADDQRKLNDVVGYFKCPDCDKHAYIEKRFDIHEREKAK